MVGKSEELWHPHRKESEVLPRLPNHRKVRKAEVTFKALLPAWTMVHLCRATWTLASLMDNPALCGHCYQNQSKGNNDTLILNWVFPTSSQVTQLPIYFFPLHFPTCSWEAPGSMLIPSLSPHLPSRTTVNPSPSAAYSITAQQSVCVYYTCASLSFQKESFKVNRNCVHAVPCICKHV